MDGLNNVVIEEVISISDSDSTRSSVLVAPNRRLTTVRTEALLQQSSPPINEEIVTLSSASERCPVTWSGKKKSKQNFLNPDTFFSPSPRSKVSHWLTENAIQYYSQKQIELESTLVEPLVRNPLDDGSRASTNKSSIIIRQDYNKDKTNVQSTSCSKLINNANEEIENKDNTLVLESSFDLSKHSSDNSNRSKIEITDNNITAYQFEKPTDDTLLIPGQDTEMSNCEQVNDVDIEEIPTTPPLSARKLVEDMLSACSPSDINSIESSSKRIEQQRRKSLTDVPLSPETQKKIELCEYLKLMNMNPANGRSVAIRQNRRSSRVKHLALLSEKKKLERRLNTELQETDKKKSVKSSDGDSKHSSDNDKGSKSSSSKRASNTTSISSISSTLPLQSILSSQETPANEGIIKMKQPLEKSNESKTPSEKRSGNKTPSKLVEVATPERSKAPAKFLQVHEVSTTSISKAKSSTKKEKVEVKSSEKKPMTLRKSDSSINLHVKEKILNNVTPKLDVITKKSFTQLHMDINKLKPLRHMRQHSLDSSSEENIKSIKSVLNFSFAESALKLPNVICHFDESVKLFLDEIHMNNNKNNKKLNNVINNNNNNDKSKNLKRRMSSPRKDGSDGGPKAKVRKLNGALRKMLRSTASKFKIKKTKERSNEKAKRPSTRLANKLEKHKMYGSPLHINKLRSRGRLKQIRMKNVLLKDQKKKYIKKKVKPKLFIFNKEKDFKTTEMIQHGNEIDLATKESSVVNEVIPPPLEVLEKSPSCDTSPIKFTTPHRIKKRLPDPEVWKNFTLEHRKAYIESIKFIKDEGNILIRNDFSPNKAVANKELILEKEENKEAKTVVENQEKINCVTATTYGFETPKPCTIEMDRISVADIKRQAITPALSTVSSSKYDKVQLSSEDLEVDRLMRGKKVKDQATQKDNESPHVNNTSSDIVTSDHSRSLSSDPSSSSSSNSSSLQTVQSNLEPIPSTSKQDILKIPLEVNSPPIDGEVEVNETHSITPCSSAKESDDQDDCEEDEDMQGNPGKPEVVNISQIEPTTCEYVHLTSNDSYIRTLHHCLTQPKQKHIDKSRDNSPTTKQNWEEEIHAEKSSKSDRKALKQSHTIFLSNNNGAVINAYYVDFNLVVVQELMIGFWTQTPLGNILGAQDMWISKGSTRRMVLGNGCIGKESSEMVISCNNSVAYVELWIKEHKSDKRERPVADVFVAIYMRLNRNGPDKKVLQLENIKGFASDVQYIVLRSSRSIIVSWTVNADSISSTIVHLYHLSPDFQMVSSITEMQAVDHYVSSLHNIEDCDTLVMGCGEAKVTLWNLEHGYIVATIDLMEIHPRPRAVWTKCDRGFLFTLQQSDDNILQLIAINSFDSTWKRLQTYKPRLKHENFLGVCMEHGVLVAFYDTRIICWSAQTGEQVVEETSEDGVFLPFGKHVVVVLNNQVHVRHALEYFVTTAEDS